MRKKVNKRAAVSQNVSVFYPFINCLHGSCCLFKAWQTKEEITEVCGAISANIQDINIQLCCLNTIKLEIAFRLTPAITRTHISMCVKISLDNAGDYSPVPQPYGDHLGEN